MISRENERAVRFLEAAGYDMLNADNGTYDAWYWSHPPQYMPENCNLEDVSKIKQFVNIPVVCAGRMTPQPRVPPSATTKLMRWEWQDSFWLTGPG